MPTEWLSRKRISCLCWKITRNLKHTPALSDQSTKKKHGFPAVKMCLSQWNIYILQPTSKKCQRMCLKCRCDSLRDAGPLQQTMRGQEHCCPKQLTTQLRPVTESRHTESIRKRWNNMGTTLLFDFFKVVLDQELQDAIAEIEHAVSGGSFGPSFPMQDEGESRAAQQLPGYGCVSYRRGNSHATDECMSQPERVLSLSVLNVPLCTAHYLTQACSFGIMSPHHWW